MHSADRNTFYKSLVLLINGIDRDQDGVVGPNDLVETFNSLGVRTTTEDIEMLILNVCCLTNSNLPRSRYSGIRGFNTQVLERLYTEFKNDPNYRVATQWVSYFLCDQSDKVTKQSIKKLSDTFQLGLSESDCDTTLKLWNVLLSHPTYSTDMRRHYGKVPNPATDLLSTISHIAKPLSKKDLNSLYKIYE